MRANYFRQIVAIDILATAVFFLFAAIHDQSVSAILTNSVPTNGFWVFDPYQLYHISFWMMSVMFLLMLIMHVYYHSIDEQRARRGGSHEPHI